MGAFWVRGLLRAAPMAVTESPAATAAALKAKGNGKVGAGVVQSPGFGKVARCRRRYPNSVSIYIHVSVSGMGFHSVRFVSTGLIWDSDENK